jgi:protease I
MEDDTMKKLSGRRVAALVCDGFEQVELLSPRTALEDEGADVDVVSPASGRVKGWRFTDWGKTVKVDVPVVTADVGQYDGLLLPGGVMNPDKLRLVPRAIRFIREFVDADKPIASICHGPWTLINAGYVRGKTMTSWPSLEIDLRNAGANWVDQEVVRDGKLVTSRKPDDLIAFNREMVTLFAEQPPRQTMGTAAAAQAL